MYFFCKVFFVAVDILNGHSFFFFYCNLLICVYWTLNNLFQKQYFMFHCKITRITAAIEFFSGNIFRVCSPGQDVKL